VWIATVRARLLGTVVAAEEAVALAPNHVPAQLALASALLNEKQVSKADTVVRRISRDQAFEARGLKGRVRLLKKDARRAMTEATAGNMVGLGADILGIEPTAGLDWPWIDIQVRALASAQLGKTKEAARWLAGFPAGTLKELRESVAQHAKAAEQLMNAMALLIEESDDKSVPRDAMAVSLARLRVIAGQIDLAVALVSANPERLTTFCTGLSELLWTLETTQSRPTVGADQLRAVCTPNNPHATPITESAECTIP
jgi:hypothetical protein